MFFDFLLLLFFKVSALLGKLGVSGSFAILYVYSLEVFPTSVRNSAMVCGFLLCACNVQGACSFCAHFGAILSPNVILLSEIHVALPYVLYALAALV